MRTAGKKMRVVQFLLALLLSVGILFTIENSVKAATPKVTGVTQTEADNVSVTVEWDTVFGLDGYLYSRIAQTSQMDTCTEKRLGHSDYITEAFFSGLNAGKTYYVQIGTSATSQSSGAPDDTVWSDVVEVVTAPKEVESSSIQYDGATETSVAVSWGAADGATSYRILAYVTLEGSDATALSYTSDTASATLSGLQKNSEYTVKIYALRSNSSGTYTANASDYSYAFLHYVPTLPTKITGVDCTFFDMSVKRGAVTFSWDENAVADGYQYEIYKYNGKKVLVKGDTSYYYLSFNNKKLKTRQIYKIRVRAYVKTSNDGKEYGAWSSYEYFGRMAGSDVSLKKSGSQLKTSWKKVAGATSYTVYLATTSNASSSPKYKKVGTTSKTSYTIKNAKVKSGKWYYVRVVPNYKKSGKTYTATINSSSTYSAFGYLINGKKWYYYTY